MITHFNKIFPTQEGPNIEDVPPPRNRYSRQDFEETLDILFYRALEVGEQQSQAMIANGREPAPRAHMACTSYHAIEIIRQLQDDVASLRQEVQSLEDRIEQVYIDQAGEDW